MSTKLNKNDGYVFDKTGKEYFIPEKAIARMLDNHIIFIGTTYPEDETTGLYVNANDFFLPGADMEPFFYNEIESLWISACGTGDELGIWLENHRGDKRRKKQKNR